ncbi:MAG: FAD-dependent oxidoreductase [Alphaproteobacteria bacterium]|nr:FAD-dependent oxidoreductase [Alphaproteobacteria bacterium]
MKIAIIGAGITGMGAAWLLNQKHAITVYEAASRPGGHSNTVLVEAAGTTIPVDTGFIVYNEATYPNLIRLFATLGVETEASDMSFSVSARRGQLEYEGSLRGLVAQPSNLARPSYWRMLKDVARFYREAPALLQDPAEETLTLRDYLSTNGYSDAFVEDHLLPMGAAIWSSSLDDMLEFPAVTFIRFSLNHGLLKIAGRPQWRTVTGGSQAYVEKLTAAFADRLRLGSPVKTVRRTQHGVLVRDAAGAEDRFDHVVLACHADQALAMLGDDATPDERFVMGAFRYAANRAILHRDAALMPRRRAAWASWNYLAGDRRDGRRKVAVSYWMNKLQNIDPKVPLFVTLNPYEEPRPSTVIGEFVYHHPQFDAGALAAQHALPSIQGRYRTWFCGSYCGYGFHEDGLQAGFAVAEALGAPAPWAGEIVPMSPAAVTAAPLPMAEAAE